ncbi:MAG: PAS domain-containing protein [Chloroflexota bacterium]
MLARLACSLASRALHLRIAVRRTKVVGGPMAIASQPIVTSEGQGPIRGTFIVGRYLGSAEIRRLAERTRTSLAMNVVGGEQMLPGDGMAAASLSKDHPIAVRPLSPEVVAGYGMVFDVHGEPALVLRADIPREIYRQGLAGLDYLMASLLLIGLVFGLTTILLLERLVVSRVVRLSGDVEEIGARGDLSARVFAGGSDEIGSPAGATNRMLEALERTQRELRESHQRAMSTLGILESITDPFVAVDREWRITYMNPRAQQILPDIDGQLLGKVIWDQLSEPLRGRLQQECRWAVAEQTTVEFELSHPAEDSWFAVHAYPHQYGLTAHFRDISERKRLEEQLLRARRLETAGRIAGQVAHDFNNLLGPLSAYPELIKMQLPQDHPASRYCDAMLEASERMAIWTWRARWEAALPSGSTCRVPDRPWRRMQGGIGAPWLEDASRCWWWTTTGCSGR